jgi:hypothetical protein
MDPMFLRPEDDGPDCFQEARAAIEAQLFVQPRPGTKAADLAPAEKMWLLRAAGVPMRPVFNGTMMHMMTTVLCGIADRGDGTYIVAMRTACGGVKTL